MKKTIYLLGSVFLLMACHTSSDSKSDALNQRNAKIENVNIDTTDVDLNGIWGLTNYFDTIIVHKELAKYRLQVPTWFGIILQIKDDSLISYGSLVETKKQLNLNSTTLTIFDAYDTWKLKRKGSLLLLIPSSNRKQNDTTTYIYRKRADLVFMTQQMDKVHKISSNVVKYFNQHLIAGNYQNVDTNKKVTFKPDGKLIGFEKYDAYYVRNYFGTRHPHKNLDAITFYDSATNEYKQYNWKFDQEYLILTEFISEVTMHDGEKVVTDDYVLGSQKLKLKIY